MKKWLWLLCFSFSPCQLLAAEEVSDQDLKLLYAKTCQSRQEITATFGKGMDMPESVYAQVLKEREFVQGFMQGLPGPDYELKQYFEDKSEFSEMKKSIGIGLCMSTVYLKDKIQQNGCLRWDSKTERFYSYSEEVYQACSQKLKAFLEN